jgi:hypothetical protein
MPGKLCGRHRSPACKEQNFATLINNRPMVGVFLASELLTCFSFLIRGDLRRNFLWASPARNYNPLT